LGSTDNADLDYGGGGGFDMGNDFPFETEYGRLGTNTVSATSFELDTRKELPWASPLADRVSRRRLSAGYVAEAYIDVYVGSAKC